MYARRFPALHLTKTIRSPKQGFLFFRECNTLLYEEVNGMYNIREVVRIDAKSKVEAIAALETALEQIKKREYDDEVIEAVYVNDGVKQTEH